MRIHTSIEMILPSYLIVGHQRAVSKVPWCSLVIFEDPEIESTAAIYSLWSTKWFNPTDANMLKQTWVSFLSHNVCVIHSLISLASEEYSHQIMVTPWLESNIAS